jgi:hypothetical protein
VADVETVRGHLERVGFPTTPKPAPAKPKAHSPVDEAVCVFQRWLHMPDADPLLAVFGTVAANLLPGDPVWLLEIGPPSSGKTEAVQSVKGLPYVHAASTLTEASLLSGTSRKDRQASSTGGLLCEVNDFGILLVKDFTSVLSMHSDARAGVFAALREVYDGNWTRRLGTDGGLTLEWTGKVGLIGACTEAIDSAHAVMATMGERFLLLRLQEPDAEAVSRQALAVAGDEKVMRAELLAAVAAVFAQSPASPVPLSPGQSEALTSVAILAVKARSALIRDARTRGVEVLPGSESPARLVKALERLFSGMRSLGIEDADAWRIVRRIALDSMPSLRRSALETLAASGRKSLSELARGMGVPVSTLHRHLEDMAHHKVLTRSRGRSANTVLYDLAPLALRGITATPSEPVSPKRRTT